MPSSFSGNILRCETFLLNGKPCERLHLVGDVYSPDQLLTKSFNSYSQLAEISRFGCVLSVRCPFPYELILRISELNNPQNLSILPFLHCPEYMVLRVDILHACRIH